MLAETDTAQQTCCFWSNPGKRWPILLLVYCDALCVAGGTGVQGDLFEK